MRLLFTTLAVFIVLDSFGQMLDSEFINSAYEYAMNAEERISELETSNGKLHCEIHDYVVQENKMRNKIDSLEKEIEKVNQLNSRNISSFKSIFAYLFMIIAILLLYLLIKKSRT